MSGAFYDLGEMLYKAFLRERPVLYVPEEYIEIAQTVARKLKWNSEVRGQALRTQKVRFLENRKIILGLSGGLDSVYLMNRLVDEGYEVTAVYIEGLNRQSTGYELAAAQVEALLAGVKLGSIVFHAPKQEFPDNPFKNQLILSILLDIGTRKGIYRYGLGSDWETPLKDAAVGFTITDSREVNESFWAGIKARLPEAELVFIGQEKKGERLTYLYKKNPQIVENISSCISPQRFRRHLHDMNAEKYGADIILRGRCGSCYKCAMEYLLLMDAGLLRRDEGYTAHAWDVLATSKTSHRPDLFAKSVPLKKRWENLREYGS